MAKKYLSLEEAAKQLGLTTEQVMRFREQGEIRGFADRGSWKFREQDIEEFLRSQQSDSSPDIPIMTGSSSSSVLEEPDAEDLSSSDSDVRLFFDESLFADDDASKLASSGSDVRLTGDSGPSLEADSDDDQLDLSGWDSDVKLSDSDSDVKLVGSVPGAEDDLAKTSQMSDSDSDVVLSDDSDLKLSDSDSDVRLSEADDLARTDAMPLSDSDSDSDVKLMGSDDLLFDDDSDSDVKLATGLDRTDSDIRLAEPSPPPDAKTVAFSVIPDDSDLKLIKKGSGVRQQPDSGISLEVRGSGLGLDADESGLALEGDSGISLDVDDSGISLESFDSGAMLGDDSGITLDAGDSGISLDSGDDSGIALDRDDMSRTMPMQLVPGANALLSQSTDKTTELDMPAEASGNDSEFELAGLDDDDDDAGTSTSILTFEDEESADTSRTVASPVGRGAAVEEEEEIADEKFADETYEDDEDIGGEYDEADDMDVQDAEDFDDEDFEAGQSQVVGGFAAGARAPMRAEADWGIAVKVMIGLSTVLSILCAVIGIELVRTMWLWTQPGTEAPASAILQQIGGLF